MPIRTVPNAGILIVDDERDILTSLQALLRTEMPQVDTFVAGSGSEALEILKREQRIGLIIADYRMPKMDGLQFLREAKKIRGGLPTMMMTAYPDPDLAVRAVKDFGVGLFIAKPFDLHYFVSVVASFVHALPRMPPN